MRADFVTLNCFDAPKVYKSATRPLVSPNVQGFGGLPHGSAFQRDSTSPPAGRKKWTAGRIEPNIPQIDATMIPHIGNGKLPSIAGRRGVVQTGIPLFRLSLPGAARGRSFEVVLASLCKRDEGLLADGAFSDDSMRGMFRRGGGGRRGQRGQLGRPWRCPLARGLGDGVGHVCAAAFSCEGRSGNRKNTAAPPSAEPRR